MNSVMTIHGAVRELEQFVLNSSTDGRARVNALRALAEVSSFVDENTPHAAMCGAPMEEPKRRR